MLGFQGVIVSDDATGFGAELVGCGRELGEEGEFGPGAHDVEDVAVVVERVDAVWVGVEEGREDRFCFVQVCGMEGARISASLAWDVRGKRVKYLSRGRRAMLAVF